MTVRPNERKDTMKTKILIKLLPAGIALLSIAFLATRPDATSYLPALAIASSYLAVTILVALAASDYKVRRLKM